MHKSNLGSALVPSPVMKILHFPRQPVLGAQDLIRRNDIEKKAVQSNVATAKAEASPNFLIDSTTQSALGPMDLEVNESGKIR